MKTRLLLGAATRPGRPLNSCPLGGAGLPVEKVVAKKRDQHTAEEGNEEEVAQNWNSDDKDEDGPERKQQSRYGGTHRDAIDANPRMSVHAWIILPLGTVGAGD